ncbi:MAG: hypothetical protein IT379_16360 [Deltaproteobacteria bacterium]|nr:hypothetical protein [Deltaproteobacteria bacterium]
MLTCFLPSSRASVRSFVVSTTAYVDETTSDPIALGIAAAVVMAPGVRAVVLDGLGAALRGSAERELDGIEAGATSSSGRTARLETRLRSAVANPERGVPLSLRARAAVGPVAGAPPARPGFRPWRAAAAVVTAVMRSGGGPPDVASDLAAGRIVVAETCATLDGDTRATLMARLAEGEREVVGALLRAYEKVERGHGSGSAPAAAPERSRLLAMAMARRATVDPAHVGALVRGAATLLPTDDGAALGCDLARLEPSVGRWARTRRERAA